MGNWGIKVSKPGVDVTSLDANNENPNLLFTSKYDGLKIAQTGSGTFSRGSSATIAHGLGEPKAFIIYLSLDGTNYYAYDGRSYIDSTNLVIQKDREITYAYYYNTDSYYNNAYETDSTYYNGSTKLGHSNDGGVGTIDGAIRFTNVTEARNATVTKAELFCYLYSRVGGTVQVRTYGIDEGNTSDFVGSVFGRTRTTENVQNSCDGSIPNDSFWAYEITGIYNEIITRNDWNSGNAMGYLLLDNGTTGDNNMRISSGATETHIKLTKTGPASTVYYKYVIFTHKLDGTKAI